MENIIEIKNLEKTYGNRNILNNINLGISKGEVITIIGPSGAGKSTLLRCINFLEEITKGQILFHNKKINKIEQYRSKVGMVFQSFNLFNNMSVLENCILGPEKLLNMNKDEATSLAKEYLQKVGMEKYINLRPNQLSGGQKQRVAIARALCMKPEVLLFDEPTSALDPEMVGEVLKTIKELANEGMTMVIVTHEMKFALEVSNRIIFIEKGNIIEDNKNIDILNSENAKRTIEFLNNK